MHNPRLASAFCDNGFGDVDVELVHAACRCAMPTFGVSVPWLHWCCCAMAFVFLRRALARLQGQNGCSAAQICWTCVLHAA
jgi:hypothetical protein